MKRILLLAWVAATAAVFTSCSSHKGLQDAAYEDDEIYYQKGERFGNEGEAQADPGHNAEIPEASDDYYDPSYSDQPAQPDYRNDPGSSGWDSFGGPGRFGYRPNWIMSWNPWVGWHMTYNFGYDPCWGNGFNTWNDPWYWNNPWYMGNGWNAGWNMWNDPWCFNQGFNYWNPYGFWQNPYMYGWPGMNAPWWSGGWNPGEPAQQVVFGHRSPVAASSVFSSTYADDWTPGDRLTRQPPGEVMPPSEPAVRPVQQRVPVPEQPQRVEERERQQVPPASVPRTRMPSSSPFDMRPARPAPTPEPNNPNRRFGGMEENVPAPSPSFGSGGGGGRQDGGSMGRPASGGGGGGGGTGRSGGGSTGRRR